MNNLHLLSEAFTDYITFGELRNLNNTGSLLPLTKGLSNGSEFSIEDKLVKKLTPFIQSKLESGEVKDSDIMFTIDPKIRRFKIPTVFEQELNLPMTLVKILDSRFAGFTSKTSTNTNSSIIKSGYNQGDIDEFVLGLGILTFLVCDHQEEVIPLVTEALSSLESSPFSTTKNGIQFRVTAKLKYPQLITYLKELTSSQLQTIFHKVEKFVSGTNGGWQDVKKKITLGEIEAGATVSIISAGSSDSKMDKSDWVLQVDQGGISSVHGISVKSNNRTFHRFSCLNLLSTLEFLSLFQIIPSESSTSSLSRKIKSLKDKFSVSDTNKSRELITEGKELCTFISKFITDKFEQFTDKDKVSNFVLTPVINALKGIDPSTHIIPFTISDVKKGISFVVGSTDFSIDSSNKELVKVWNDLGKKLTVSKRYDPDGYPKLIVSFAGNGLYQIRFTKSHLSTPSPKITGMFEIIDFPDVMDLMKKTTGK